MARTARKRKCKGPGYRLHFTLYGHTSAISSVKFSPSGLLLASCDYDKAIKIWDINGGNLEVNLIGHEQGTSDIDWSKDSSLLVSASDDRTLKIWDVNRGSCVSTLQGHTAIVFCAKFNESSDRIISGSDDLSVKVWDVASGACIKTINDHTDRVSAVDISPEGSVVHAALSSGLDGNCYLYDPNTFEAVIKIPTQKVAVSFAKFSPNGRYVLLSTLDNKITLWDMRYAARGIIKAKRTYNGHRNVIFSVFANFSVTGGKWVVSGSEDQAIYVWDINTEKVVEKIRGHDDVVLCVDCHPTENMIASGALEMDRTVRIWKS